MYQPSIEYLELYAVTVSIYLWLHEVRNKRIILSCNNESVVSMTNGCGLACHNCHQLIRLITLYCIRYNVRVFAHRVVGPKKQKGGSSIPAQAAAI